MAHSEDTPGPAPHDDRPETRPPDSTATAAAPTAGTAPRSGRTAGRRTGVAVAGAALLVVAAGAAPFAWQALDGEADGKTKPRPAALSGPAGTEPAADFDADGIQDVHATGETGGAVFVAYGSKDDDGAGKGGRLQRLALDSPGVPGEEGKGVIFAQQTVARDLDEDGYTDLVAAVKRLDDEDAGTPPGLIALWGSAKGLSGGTYLEDVPDDYQSNGPADDPLVAGDFTADGTTDLVLRVGSEKGLLKGPFSRDGKPSGTGEAPNPFPETGQDAGFVGAYAGDMNGDGTDDLIHSHVLEQDGVGGGKVRTSYVKGGPGGFGKPDTKRLPGIETAATGDVDKDGYTDVVLRRYAKNAGPDSAATGPVEVFHGSKDGPDPDRHTEIDQDTPGVPGKKHDVFGTDLATGDVNDDGYADVAAGAPMSTLDKAKSSVTVLRGGPDGLTGRGARRVEEPAAAPKPPEDDGRTIGNRFGHAVRLGDVNADGKADLAVGAPVTELYRGALWVVPGDGRTWPGEGARHHRPEDFKGEGETDDAQLGADVR